MNFINLNKIVQTWDMKAQFKRTCIEDRYEQIWCYPQADPVDDNIPQHNLNMLFEILVKPLDDALFIPTPHLEQLDEDLREAYENHIEDDEDDLQHMIVLKEKPSDFEIHNNCNSIQIDNYINALNISRSEAFELLRRCHYCGSTEMEFGNEYCNEICETHMNLDYPCHWNRLRWSDPNVENCKICKLTEKMPSH